MQTSYQEDEIEIDLQDLFGLLLHKIWIIILAAVVAGAIGFAVSFFLITPQYESTTSIYISTSKGNENSMTYSDAQLASQLTKDSKGVYSLVAGYFVNGTITLAGTPISVADKCEVFVISADGKTISATNVNAIQKDDNDKVWYKTNSDGEVTTIVIQTVDAAGSAGSSSEETYEWEVNANTLRVNLTYSSNTTSVSDVDVMNNAGYALQQAGYVVNEWGGSYTQSLTATLTSSGLTAHAYKGTLDITFTIFMAKATA